MSAAGQLAMFEPVGEELSRLVAAHASAAERFERSADAYAVRGFEATARAMRASAAHFTEQASVCEMALQFEQEAGL